jgi:predicted ArsR family transcriptional regulator
MMPSGPDRLSALAGLASLDEPVRRRLYEYVSEQGLPVSRDEAAAAVGVTRTLAAYHLDKLADAGLLATAYQRPPGRGGPGAGRPAKLYQNAGQELTVSVPPRAYELLAQLLAEAAESDTTGRVRGTLNQVAHNLGHQVGTEAGANLTAALRGCGYQPYASTEGTLELRNCPFHRLAQQHQELVCGLNLRLIEGVITGSAHPRASAALSPGSGRCCVVVHGA